MLRTVRSLHKWTGICASAVLCVIGLTGLLLNHEEWVERDWRVATGGRRGTPYGLLNNERAGELMAEAATACDRLEVEEVKVKRERGGYVWEIKSPGRRKVRVRNGVRIVLASETKGNLKHVLEDLHKGKFLNPLGNWLLDAGGVSLLLLTVTGLYLWLDPVRRRRRRRLRIPSAEQ